MAGFGSGASAPPHNEPDEQERASRKSGDRQSAAAFRGRLGKTGVYKASGDTGKSGTMPTGKRPAIAPLELNPGAKGGRAAPRSFKPMKT
jgi:hypothetical protein